MGSISETPGYDRQAELKTFDEPQAGVKGLVDSRITEIPCIFHIPPHLVDARPVVGPSDGFTIPIIDLDGASGEKRKRIVEEIREASAKWGCFQVVNHGAPLRVLEGMDGAVRGFFDLDLEEKKEFFGRDNTTKRFVYNSNIDLYYSPFATWRDSTLFHLQPDPPLPHDFPLCYRGIAVEYCKEVLKVGDVILELLSEALGLNSNQLKEMGCAKGIYVASHYYPACPQPELTQGTSLHQDNDFITVLYQDHNGGLQFLHQDHWVDVPPVPGAFVINIGDLLQLISNDKFVSMEHRVEAKTIGPRVSVACSFTTGFAPNPRLYGPIKELLSEENPAIFAETTIPEYTAYYYKESLNKCPALDHFRL